MNWSNITLICLLILIVYQDFRFRGINWFILFLTMINMLITRLLEQPINIFEEAIKLGFLTINFLVLFVYYSIKNKRITNIVNKYLGIADILLFIGICFVFSPINFILFFVSSLFIALILSFVLGNTSTDKNFEIPLAGLVGIQLTILIVINLLFNVSLQDDSWIIENYFSHGLFQS